MLQNVFLHLTAARKMTALVVFMFFVVVVQVSFKDDDVTAPRTS